MALTLDDMATGGITSRRCSFLELRQGLQRLTATRAPRPATVGTTGNCLFAFATLVNFPTLHEASRRVGIFFSASPATDLPLFILVTTLDSAAISDSGRLATCGKSVRRMRQVSAIQHRALNTEPTYSSPSRSGLG